MSCQVKVKVKVPNIPSEVIPLYKFTGIQQRQLIYDQKDLTVANMW